MKYSETDLLILTAAQHNADGSIPALAKKLHLREHTVRRTLDTFLERGAIFRRPYLDCFRLGFLEVAVYISLDSASARNKARLRNALMESRRVGLLLELGSKYDFLVLWNVVRANEVESLIDQAAEQSKTVLVSKDYHLRTGWYHFGAKYLFNGWQAPAPLPFLTPVKRVEIDKTDNKVLAVYCNSGGGNISKMAHRAGIAESTYAYRVSRLKKQGVIAQTIYQIDPEHFGRQAYRLLVSTRSPHLSFRRKLIDWSAKHPNIVSLIFGLGRWDYELRVEIENTMRARIVADEFLEQFEKAIDRVEVVPVAKVLKIAGYPLLPGEDLPSF